ncbi:hypothetical protein NLM27_27375 [Bradyrhizobium sp. CCGB12]|uniref:hypothetical protein n=1 Tax=Bradyrhizobium sp. CCGB12 TaxID=2949632 RepID=UPI0020B1C0AB|nr:hypothetical protein [Bradyrhizobium sp. CCGB12]MCP3392472.1 hypothetical protein [Bradyrhizobium sp. CCGB12]
MSKLFDEAVSALSPHNASGDVPPVLDLEELEREVFAELLGGTHSMDSVRAP